MKRDMKAYAKELLALAKAKGCAGAEVCITENDEFSVGVLKGSVEEYSVSGSFALGLRVQVEGRNGYAYTEAMEDGERLVREAMDNARSVASTDEHPMAGPAEYPEVPAKPNALEGMSAGDRIELCRALERAALSKSPLVKRVALCRVAAGRGRFCIYNTLGLEAEREDGVSCCYVEPVAERGQEVKDGFAFRADGEAGDIEGCAKEAVEEALNQLGAGPVSPGKYRVLLRNDAAASLLAAFSGMFSADAVQKGLSPLMGKEGQAVASHLITIVDDPMHPVSPTPFDDEGTPSVSKAVVDKGVLSTLLHNLKTAKKAGVKSTSNGGRGSAGSPVGVRPSNFYIRPGEEEFEALKERLGSGLLITDFAGMHAGVNGVSGQFSLSCKGRLIENGQDVRAVNEITIGGSFTGLLAQVEAVGKDIRFSMPGGSCFGSPSLLIKEAAISGK